MQSVESLRRAKIGHLPNGDRTSLRAHPATASSNHNFRKTQQQITINSLKVVNSGENALFNCTVSGSPIGRVQWFHNGETLLTEGNPRLRLLNNLALSVVDVTRHDKGMYQCVVQNDRESSQGSAELRLGGTYL